MFNKTGDSQTTRMLPRNLATSWKPICHELCHDVDKKGLIGAVYGTQQDLYNYTTNHSWWQSKPTA